MNALSIVGARFEIGVEVTRILRRLEGLHEDCKYAEVRYTTSPHIDAALSAAWYRIGEAIRALENAEAALMSEPMSAEEREFRKAVVS